MSTVRRDKKRRVLRTGESQYKDGKYRYTFYENGKQKCFYSWKLVRTDTIPYGKRDCRALRDMEDDLRRSKDKGLAYQGGGMTVYELTEKYIKQKRGVKHTTQAGYQTVLNVLKKDSFGDTRIDKIKLSDVKIWLIQLQENGRSYSSIHSIRGVLRPAFQMAVDDDLLIKNPFDFQLATVIVNDSVTREAISLKQMRQFIEFVRNDKHFCRYADAIEILFKTGLRISEFCGLTTYDIDLNERKINVDHQLQRTSKMEYVIEGTKTNAGTRQLPMSDEVYDCFKRIIENRQPPKTEPMIDGYAGFLYLDKNGMPMVALHWEKYFEHIVQKYNKTYRIQMPKVTPHVCRHTYCSNMARSGMNPKSLQYLMGHSDIGVTLNTYTHVGYEDAQAEMQRINMPGSSKDKMFKKQA
ncbi:tyrosine-type recombinase/integrase [Blautia sp.]|uniref:tyrosine-type recombinase/integrase n=1 Tax=Blautia sp. TaxID=1955243 RepID=UPI003A34A29E